jgi:hypothetical protein
MYPAMEIDLRLDRVSAAQPPTGLGLGKRLNSL